MNWIENPHPLQRKLPVGVDFYDIVVIRDEYGREFNPDIAGISFLGHIVVTHYYFYHSQQIH